MSGADHIEQQCEGIFARLIAAGHLKKGDLVAVGCSSSAVGNFEIGSHSNEEVGQIIFSVLSKLCKKSGLYLAAQCCEHLNRALVVEEELACARGYARVCAVPWLKGGGSFATAAYHGFKNPVLVESVQAEAGMDIGGVLIGMHIKPVAVPLHLEADLIGAARVTCAYSRPKLIGGERARYTE